jgi:hypothetical protein
MPANPAPGAVRVLFNFFHYDPPTVLGVIVNGHIHPVSWPYRDQNGFTWRTLAVTIPVTDLVAGTNVVQIGADQAIVSSNIDIVLAAVPGGVPVLPGSNNAYPGSGPPPTSCTVTMVPPGMPVGTPPANLAITNMICPYDPVTKACSSPPSSSSTVTIPQGQTAYFSNFTAAQCR